MSANSDFSPSLRPAGATSPSGAPHSRPEVRPVARPEVRLQLPGTPESLPPIRMAVVEAAEACGFSDEEVAKIEMAVGEACTNIIEHAYRTEPLKLEIEVRVCVLPDRLEVTILDYSTIDFPLDETNGMTIDRYIETERKRGLGLFIIRSFVDDVQHKFVYGRGNELKLTKFFA